MDLLTLAQSHKIASFGAYLRLSRIIVGMQREAGLPDQYEPVEQVLRDLVGCVPIIYWQVLLLALWMLLLWRGRQWWQQERGRFWLVVIALFACAGLWWLGDCIRNSTRAVATEAAQLYAGPSTRYTQLGSVPATAIVPLLDRSGNKAALFYKTSYLGVRGWVQHTNLTVI